MAASDQLVIRHLGLRSYHPVWQAMKEFVAEKSVKPDEIWLLQHEPVYTRGIRCKDSPVLPGQHIPVIDVDRGGLMSYHGPGQLVIYFLINLSRKKINIRQMVSMLEQSVINFLSGYSIQANRIEGAPGVYLGEQKLASIGLRVRHHTTYHGLSINFDMDLQPYNWINPCGFKGLQVVQLSDLTDSFIWQQAQQDLLDEIIRVFDYSCLATAR